MQQITITLPTQTWRGLKTKYTVDEAEVGPDNFISGSQNFDTDVNGNITKRPGGVLFATTPTPAKDKYEAIFSDGTHHDLIVENGNLRYTAGATSYTLVTSGYSSLGNFEFSIYKNRVYFDNGIDNPQVYDKTASYGGVGYTVPKTKEMGAQPPVSAPTFGADTAGGSVPAGGHTYKVTFLYYDFEESNGGPASALHTVSNPNNTVHLTSVPIGGYGVTARKIYRDDNDGNWLLIGTINDNTTTIFTDTFSVGTAPIPTGNGLPPTFTLIVTHLDRNFVAGVPGSPSTIYFSQAGLPDIFNPLTGFVLCNPKDPITGLIVYNNRIIVFNRNSMGQILGNTTSSFNYATIPSSVGCVDNRSIAIRTIRGVPVVVWLSDKGFYQYNGQSVDYISEDIEDQVNLNIQQAIQVKGRNAQDTQSDFSGGTASPGIDLVSDPGFITTKPTQRLWQSETDWNGGSSLTNVVSHDGSNTIKVPQTFAPALSDGTYNNIINGGSGLTLTLGGDFTGETVLTSQGIDNRNAGFKAYAQQIISPFAGTIGSIGIYLTATPGPQSRVRISIWSDNLGSPGSQLTTGSYQFVSFSGTQSFNAVVNYGIAANTHYWIGVEFESNQNANLFVPAGTGWIAQASNVHAHVFNGSVWTIANDPGGHEFLGLIGTYNFTKTPIAEAGQWLSPTDDTGSTSISPTLNLVESGTYPSGTSAVIMIEGSNDNSSFVVTDTINDPSGTTPLTGSGYRYWRIRVTLNTTDDRIIPTVTAPSLTFNTQAIWISEVIDCTTDVVSFDTLSSVFSGTPSIQIASSPDNLTYSPYQSIGTVPVQRYIKVRATMNGADVVTSILFQFTLTANLISSAIDTGSTPAGWELFQSRFTLNGGTISFFVRTATTAPGLSVATFFPVTNGQFITAPINEFIQWKVVITSSAAETPNVDNVTINWFISQGGSIRVASIFFNRNYYVAAAEYGNSVNNIVFKYDQDNTWKVYRGININAFSYFFNDPYYADSSVGRVVLFDKSLTDLGTAINMDARVALKTGARLPNDMDDKIKILKEVTCIVKGTGGTYQFYFSVDSGTTWTLMKSPISGLYNFSTANDGNRYVVRMVPVFDVGTALPGGRMILLRIVESTTASAEVRSLKARLWIRDKQKVLTNNA